MAARISQIIERSDAAIQERAVPTRSFARQGRTGNVLIQATTRAAERGEKNAEELQPIDG